MSISKLGYVDNGSSVSLTVPEDQTGEYEIQYCSNSSFSSCVDTVIVSCASPNGCVRTSGGSGTFSYLSEKKTVVFTYQRGALTSGSTSLQIRVRTRGAAGLGSWLRGDSCTFNIPASCWSD